MDGGPSYPEYVNRKDLHGRFYQLLRDRFERRCVALQMELAKLSSHDLLKQYTAQKTRYNSASTLISNVCKAFERRLIQRAKEEGHGDVYPIVQVTWHKLVFKPLANTLASANPAGLTSEERQTVEDAKSAIPLLVDEAEQGADEEV
ncbi:hypothetical protein RTBOTA2_006977 [Rhodotorula toruloides]|nr:hypothetical protein RTBOTA2_006977 [Rhodotorula toruloides]